MRLSIGLGRVVHGAVCIGIGTVRRRAVLVIVDYGDAVGFVRARRRRIFRLRLLRVRVFRGRRVFRVETLLYFPPDIVVLVFIVHCVFIVVFLHLVCLLCAGNGPLWL